MRLSELLKVVDCPCRIVMVEPYEHCNVFELDSIEDIKAHMDYTVGRVSIENGILAIQLQMEKLI